jgi:hypothetical protein
MKISLLIALGIGLVWLVLVQILPFAMSAISIFLSVAIALGIAILLFVDPSKGFEGKEVVKLVVAIILILIAFFIVGFILMFKRRIRLMGLFLAWST